VTRKREAFGTQVDADLQERVRAAVGGVRRATGTEYTLAQLVEDALTRHVIELEDTHNHGEPFPVLDAPLRRGRRVDISWRPHLAQDGLNP
jgi:hypothetical protein